MSDFQETVANVQETRMQLLDGRLRWIDVDTDRVQRHRIPVNVLSRAPATVLAERDAASAADLTPNMAVLGDPLPGRSALDAKLRAARH